MKKIILTYCHYQGWGDSMISIFDILNLTEYIRNNHQDIYITFLINDINNLDVENILSGILDFDFFISFFDEFKIQVMDFSKFNENGSPIINGDKYRRIYSGRNDNVTNNTPGIFDCYVEEKDFEYFSELKIPFIEFTFNEIDDRVKDFPIFNSKILENVDNFIKTNFSKDFYSLCYRSKNPINYENLNKFIFNIKQKLSSDEEYFLCSNSVECKEKIKETGLNIKLIRDIEQHQKNDILNGFPVGENRDLDAFYSVCEMILLSKSKKIYYSGEFSWVSLFTFYAKSPKKVELQVLNNV